MSIRRGLLLTIALLLGTAILAACGTSQDSVAIPLTPGPAPPAHPGANVWVCGSPDLVIGSADGGHTWQVRHRDTSIEFLEGTLWSIAFGDLTHGWAVARGDSRSRARVLATADGGGTWTSHYPGVKGGWLVSVAAMDARHVWAVGHQGSPVLGRGLILASSDGGRTWRRQRLPTGLVPTAVAFADARQGWAVAVEDAANASPPVRYSVLSTSDGGTHWRTSYSTAAGDVLNGLAAVGPDHCWVVGYAEQQHAGLVVRTTDGGLHWSAQRPVPRQSLKGVSFPNARDGWAVGGGGTVLVTHDGGATWAPQSSGVRLDLHRVSFSDPQHGWALVAARELLATGDGGKTWSVVRPEGSGDLMLGLSSFDSGEAGK
jgi:photosystem II stability/assembly factor-like uncharacterized protein